MRAFPLAPMSTLILVLTGLLLSLPAVCLVWAAAGGDDGRDVRLLVGGSVAALYVYVWLRMRPTRFEVDGHSLSIVWPLCRQAIPKAALESARVASLWDLNKELGLALRVGVGGLWGGFGFLWTRRRGWVDMYVSRGDGLVWIERRAGRPLLLTPAEPDAFVAALTT